MAVRKKKKVESAVVADNATLDAEDKPKLRFSKPVVHSATRKEGENKVIPRMNISIGISDLVGSYFIQLHRLIAMETNKAPIEALTEQRTTLAGIRADLLKQHIRPDQLETNMAVATNLMVCGMRILVFPNNTAMLLSSTLGAEPKLSKTKTEADFYVDDEFYRGIEALVVAHAASGVNVTDTFYQKAVYMVVQERVKAQK